MGKWGWEGERLVGVSVQSMGEVGKDFCPNFLKTLTEGAVTTEAGNLFQYFTTLTENADPLLRRWSTLKGCPLRPHRPGGRINIQKALEYLELISNVRNTYLVFV